MNEQVKKKLCWNCEGSVAKHLETCPYCGVYLSPSEHDDDDDRKSSLAPPYPSQNLLKGANIPKPPFQSNNQEEDKEEQETPTSQVQFQGSFLSPLLMFIVGTSFALFGISLWLFSDKGHLTLSWNEDWAGVFMLVAAPLLFFGTRSLIQLED